VEGVSGNGEGQRLALMTAHISEARGVKVKIRNGYQKSSGLLEANAAPREVRIILRSGTRMVTEQKAELKREMGWQEVEISIPESQGFDTVDIEVLSVHKGSRYQDTCISDVQVFVDSDVEWNQVVESARYRQLEAWVSERQEIAAYFASQPIDYPFASTVFSLDETQDEVSELMKLREAADQKRARVSSSEKWVELTVQKELRSLPDGIHIWFIDAVDDYLRADHFALFEAKDGGRVVREVTTEDLGNGEVYEYGFTERSNFKVLWHDSAPAVPDMLLFEYTKSVTERTTDTTTSTWLLDYDESGRLLEAYRWFQGDDDFETVNGWNRLAFIWDEEGRVRSVEHWRQQKIEPYDEEERSRDPEYYEESLGRDVFTAAAE